MPSYQVLSNRMHGSTWPVSCLFEMLSSCGAVSQSVECPSKVSVLRNSTDWSEFERDLSCHLSDHAEVWGGWKNTNYWHCQLFCRRFKSTVRKKAASLHVRLPRSWTIRGPPESPLQDPSSPRSLPAHMTSSWNRRGKVVLIGPVLEVVST